MKRKRALSLAIPWGLLIWALPGQAQAGCPQVLAALADKMADVTCFASADLTTNNPATTPANNSIAGLPVGAFTPQTDRSAISPDPPNRTPITRSVPGIQVNGRFADDATGQARFLLRLPDDWNGRLVVAGASGPRGEFNGDFVWSDYVLQKGYAYASQNKGALALRFVSLASATPPPTDPAPCRLNPASGIWIHFFSDDPEKPFTQWTLYMINAARLAQEAVKANFNHHARRTYAVGTSNGGYQVRRAMEEAPDLFDGGVDWEGTFVDPRGPNPLIDLPPAIANFPAYAASGFDRNGPAAKNILAAGYPPDIVSGGKSFWGLHWGQVWEVTQCNWQKRFDASWTTYADGPNNVDGTGGYDYFARVAVDPSILAGVAAVATTGNIKRPLITVAGTMDALLPIKRSARAYEAVVTASRKGDDDGEENGDEDREEHGEEHRKAQYRLYEVQNGNHFETLKSAFPQLELIQPHAQRAFDLLVDHVEQKAPLPPSQCIPRGGTIAPHPTEPGHCVSLLAP